jgi:hypothetical protein
MPCDVFSFGLNYFMRNGNSRHLDGLTRAIFPSEIAKVLLMVQAPDETDVCWKPRVPVSRYPLQIRAFHLEGI